MNSDEVVISSSLQHRVEPFFKEILLAKAWPLRKVKYYAIRMDDSVNEYVDFLDFIMCGNLMSEQEDSHLYQLLKTFQIHSHSKTCPKYKNMKCRLKFWPLFYSKNNSCETTAKNVKSR